MLRLPAEGLQEIVGCAFRGCVVHLYNCFSELWGPLPVRQGAFEVAAGCWCELAGFVVIATPEVEKRRCDRDPRGGEACRKAFAYEID